MQVVVVVDVLVRLLGPGIGSRAVGGATGGGANCACNCLSRTSASSACILASIVGQVVSQVVSPLGPDFRFDTCFDGNICRGRGCGLVDCLDFGCAGACSDSDVGGFGFDCVVQSDRPCWTACCRDAAVKDFVSLGFLGFLPFLVAVSTAGVAGAAFVGAGGSCCFQGAALQMGHFPLWLPQAGKVGVEVDEEGLPVLL